MDKIPWCFQYPMSARKHGVASNVEAPWETISLSLSVWLIDSELITTNPSTVLPLVSHLVRIPNQPVLMEIAFKNGCLTHWGRKKWLPFSKRHFQSYFFNEDVWISIYISLKYVPKGPINNIPASVQIMAWRRPGDKPLSEPLTVSLPTHICITRPQWVKGSLVTGICVSNFIEVWSWNKCHQLSSWAFSAKLPSGKIHSMSMMISQH